MDRESVMFVVLLVTFTVILLAIGHKTNRHDKEDQCKAIANDFHVSGELVGNNCILTSQSGGKQIVRVD